MARSLLVFGLVLGLSTGATLAHTSVASAMFACDDESGLCAEGGTSAADKKMTDKDRKKQSSSSPGSVSLEIDGGRGSLFVNGRYAGTAPLDGIEVPSGPNDIQVRDGAQVLASGMLTVPKGGSVSLTVRHD